MQLTVQLPVLHVCMQLTRARLCCTCPAVLILYIGLRHGWWLKILRCCWSVINSTGGGGSSNQTNSPKQGKAKTSRGADSDEDGSGDEEVRCACCADQSAYSSHSTFNTETVEPKLGRSACGVTEQHYLVVMVCMLCLAVWSTQDLVLSLRCEQ